MALAFDFANGSNDLGGAASSLTWSHTCTGTDLILFVGTGRGQTTDTVTGVTYNGTALTRINGTAVGGGGVEYVSLWYLINPATGAHNVVITCSNGSNIEGTSSSYTGAQQSSQPNSSNIGSGAGANITLSTTVVGSGCWLVSVIGSLNDSLSAGTGTTSRHNDNAGVTIIGDSNAVVGNGAQTMGWNVGTNNGGVIASVAPIPSGGFLALL